MELPSFLKTFQSSVQALRAGVGELEKKLEAARIRRENLLRMPPTKKEVADLITGWVRDEASKYPARLQEVGVARIVREWNVLESAPKMIAPDFLTASAISHIREDHIQAPLARQSAMAFFFERQICDGIERAIDEMKWEAGPPAAERRAELAQLDINIAQMEKQLQQLLAEAAAAGISITLPVCGGSAGVEYVGKRRVS